MSHITEIDTYEKVLLARYRSAPCAVYPITPMLEYTFLQYIYSMGIEGLVVKALAALRASRKDYSVPEQFVSFMNGVKLAHVYRNV